MFYYLIKGESITGDTLAFLLTLNMDKILGAITDTVQLKEKLTGTGSLMARLSCCSSPGLPTSRLVVCITGCFLCLNHCWLAFMLLAAKCMQRSREQNRRGRETQSTLKKRRISPNLGEHKKQKRKPKTRLGMQSGVLHKMMVGV